MRLERAIAIPPPKSAIDECAALLRLARRARSDLGIGPQIALVKTTKSLLDDLGSSQPSGAFTRVDSRERMLWRGIVMAKAHYRVLMSAFIHLLFTGCATIGKPFDTTRVEEVRKGQAEDEIVAWFGAPTRGNELSLADSAHHCVKRYRYNFATSDESHVLWIGFDTRNTVCNVIYSGGPS